MLNAAMQRSLVLPAERVELGIHALAQLPDAITLAVTAPLDSSGPATIEARAYGVEDRIHQTDVSASWTEGTTLAELVHEVGGGPAPPLGTPSLAAHRLAVVTNVPTHYRVALFNAMTEQVERAGAALHVFFLAGTPATRSWMDPGRRSFEHTFLGGLDLSRDRGRRVVPLDLESCLSAFSPTTVLVGGFSPAVAGRVALYARRRGIPFGIWSGELSSRPTARSRLRRFQRRQLVKQAAYAVAYGSCSAAYLRSLRPDLPIVIGRNSTILPEPREERDDRGDLELLAIARAEPGKALEILVDAMKRIPESHCRLTVVGDGPALPSLRKWASGDERIRFLGALPPEKTRRMLTSSDVFLFPSSYDVFGLVLVEAMGAGIATVVSSHPGAVDDLCVSEHNSLVVDGDADQWAAAISRLVRDSDLRARLGRRATETIHERWTIDHAADSMIAGFRLGALAAGGRTAL